MQEASSKPFLAPLCPLPLRDETYGRISILPCQEEDSPAVSGGKKNSCQPKAGGGTVQGNRAGAAFHITAPLLKRDAGEQRELKQAPLLSLVPITKPT